MYEGLATRLRNHAIRADSGYEIGNSMYLDILKAADAIEELSHQVEEYKAAYREEHNKRIAENRYLCDELVKVAREKLLMTPIRIEVSELPKEE